MQIFQSNILSSSLISNQQSIWLVWVLTSLPPIELKIDTFIEEQKEKIIIIYINESLTSIIQVCDTICTKPLKPEICRG